MSVTLSQSTNILTAHLSGDLDHHNAASIRADIDHAVRTRDISKLVLNFSQVSFMDSSGIGLVMGRYKLMTELGGVCIIADPPQFVSKVFRISGINRLCEIIETHESGSQPEKTSEVLGL